MNITIKINDDREIIMEPEKENHNTKKMTVGKPVFIYGYELANQLIFKGFSIKKIMPNNISNEGLIFSFYNVKGIENEIKKWSRKKYNQIDDEQQEEIIITEEGDKI